MRQAKSASDANNHSKKSNIMPPIPEEAERIPQAVGNVVGTWCRIDAPANIEQSEIGTKVDRHHVISREKLRKILNCLYEQDIDKNSLENIGQGYHKAFHQKVGVLNRTASTTLRANNSKEILSQEIMWNPGNIIFGPKEDREDDLKDGEEKFLLALERNEYPDLLSSIGAGIPIARGSRELNQHLLELQAALNCFRSFEFNSLAPRNDVLDQIKGFLDIWTRILNGGFLIGAFSKLYSSEARLIRSNGRAEPKLRAQITKESSELERIRPYAKPHAIAAKEQKIAALEEQYNKLTEARGPDELKYYLRALELGGHTTNTVMSRCVALHKRMSTRAPLVDPLMQSVALGG